MLLLKHLIAILYMEYIRNLHFTMLLLKQGEDYGVDLLNAHLHFIMLLLKL